MAIAAVPSTGPSSTGRSSTGRSRTGSPSSAGCDRLAGADSVLAFLRGLPPTDRVSVRFTASARRGLHAAAELLRAEAGGHACHLALAETGHVAAHWIDAIVWGTAEDLAQLLTAIAPALVRTGGRRAHHEVDAIVAA